MAPLQAPKKRYSAFSVCILLVTLAPISTQEEPTNCTVEGLPDDGNEFTRDVGYQLNLTCTCYMSHPTWDLVNVDNTDETHTFYIPYENTLQCEDYGTFTDETITCIPSSSSMTSFSLTIITNVSHSIVLQCRNHGTNASFNSKPIVVAINQERECTSSTSYQMATLTTPSSTLHQTVTVTVPSLTTDPISTQTPTCTPCLTSNYTSVLSPSPSPLHSSTCSNATIILPFTTTVYSSFTNNVCSSSTALNNVSPSTTTIVTITTSHPIIADPCLLTSEGTIGLSSSLAFVIVIESVAIVVLLLVIAKVSCCRNDKLKNASEYAITNGCYIEHDQEHTD